MASVKMVVRANRVNKCERCKVEIAIGHFGKTCYVDTGIEVSGKNDGNKFVPNFMNGQCTRKENGYIQKNLDIAQMLRVYQDRLARIKNVGLLNIQQLKMMLDGSEGEVMTGGVLTLEKAFRQYIDELRKEDREKYALQIGDCMKRFSEFMTCDIAVEDLRPAIVQNWCEWLKRQPAMCWHGERLGFLPKKDKDGNVVKLSDASVKKYLDGTKAVVNRFIKCGAVKFDVHPFANVKLNVRAKKNRKCFCMIEEMKRLLDATPQSTIETVAQDVFSLSFYMAGMNVADILRANWSGTSVSYVRKKTERRNNEVHTLPITDDVRAIADKYIQKDGTLNFGYKDVNHIVNEYMKDIALRENVQVFEGSVCMTTARKTWANFAGLIGVQRYVVDYCMAHATGNDIADHYQAAMVMQATAACRAVADYVKNPEKWDDVINLRSFGKLKI